MVEYDVVLDEQENAVVAATMAVAAAAMRATKVKYRRKGVYWWVLAFPTRLHCCRPCPHQRWRTTVAPFVDEFVIG